MSALNREFHRHAALAVLCMSWILAVPANADEYQDAIAKAFPGFKIMSQTEFTKDIQKAVKGNPALITGLFNDDELVDFAAMIREESRRKGDLGGEYYRGMTVVCHASDKGRYACQMLSTRGIFSAHRWFLRLVGPGKLDCYNEKIEKPVKRNAIGTATIEQGL